MRNYTLYLNEKLVQKLRQCGVENMSDLVNTLLKAWLNSLQDKGNIVDLAVQKTELIEFMKEIFKEYEAKVMKG